MRGKRKPKARRRGSDDDAEYIDRPKKKLNARPKTQKGETNAFTENREIRKDEDIKLVAKICLERDKLIQLINNPYFKDIVMNCLVKVTYRTNDKTDYRVGIIQGKFLFFYF
jgi:hypothetical protein